MTPELIDEAIASAIILFGLMGVLGIGGLIADYVFPRIGPLNRWLDSLPGYEDDDVVYEQYLADLRARRVDRRRKLGARKEER